VREASNEARAQADALLREARAQADIATIEGKALAEAVREAQQRLRDLGATIGQQLQSAQRDLSDRTSLNAVQARLRAGGHEATAHEIAEHLAKLLSAGGAAAQEPPAQGGRPSRGQGS